MILGIAAIFQNQKRTNEGAKQQETSDWRFSPQTTAALSPGFGRGGCFFFEKFGTLEQRHHCVGAGLLDELLDGVRLEGLHQGLEGLVVLQALLELT